MALLETHDLTRRFPGVVALRAVNFTARAGEVHAVCGANGAGKSTLMNVLSGTIAPSSGRVLINGKSVSFTTPAEARSAGIAIVYQEFSSIPELTVADNIFLGQEFRKGFGIVDHKRASSEARALMERFRIDLDPDAAVGTLGVADRQLLELARALSTDAQVLILDEPTGVLSLSEQRNLFEVIRTLRDRGMLILYISHRLEEIFEIADTVSVMRDGELVATREKGSLDRKELVRLMTGHEVSDTEAIVDSLAGGETVLTIDGITSDDSRILLAEGEILGLAGLVGAGRTSIARRLAGLRPRTGMTAQLKGKPLPFDAAGVLKTGLVYLTEDRKEDGIFGPLSIPMNATAAALDYFSSAGFLARRRERSEAATLLEQLRLVASSLDMPITSLSGGNQQKVLFARALLAQPKVLICDEPTRGVDVAAREDIYRLLRDLSKRGVAIIMISSELDELIAMCHRIAIVRHGAVHSVVANEDLDEHKLVLAATGSDAA